MHKICSIRYFFRRIATITYLIVWLYIRNLYYTVLDPNLLNYDVFTAYNIHIYKSSKFECAFFSLSPNDLTIYTMKTPQEVIHYILERFPYLLTQEPCSYNNYLMSFGNLNMLRGHLKNTKLMIILNKVGYARFLSELF